MISREELLAAVARAWCLKGNELKEMDATLAIAIVDEVHNALVIEAATLKTPTLPLKEPRYDPFGDDADEAEAEAEYQREREEEKLPCGCKYCMCLNTTEYGEPCYDCSNHAHQG